MTDESGATPTAPLRAGWGASVHFQPGQSFAGRYTVVEEVGAGGMGQVYKALDRKLGKTVALKVIRPETAAQDEALQRFRRELALAREVTHPNVCRLHDLGEVEGIAYISMEFVEGQTLDDLVQSVGHLSPKQTVQLARQICAGLSAIHERGIVHRDLKPGNIMVDRSGHALLMDFGMAYHQGEERLTGAGAVLGTLAYLSPEQARARPPDVASDIYAVGLVLFEMLTGRRPPGDGGAVPLALRESSERCPPPSRLAPEVPPALDHLVLRCLERDPTRRYATAAELEGALGQVAASLSSGISSPLRLLTGGRPLARRVALGALAALALVAGLLVGRGVLGRRSPVPAPARTLALLSLAYEGPPETAYLKDALPAVLATALRTSAGLHVAPFPSSRTFGADEDAGSVARQLGVASVVRGSLRVSDKSFEASLEAVRAPVGERVWSKHLQGAAGDLLRNSDALAEQIASALGEEPPRPLGGSRNPLAMRHYLEGRASLEGWDVDRSDVRAEAAFKKAIELDPRFAEAHAMLSVALWTRYRSTQDAAFVERAVDAAERARSLAPDVPEVQLAWGTVQLGRGRSAEAVDAFRKAQELAPADDAVCRSIAASYAELGRDAEAEGMYQRAIDLRPAFWEGYHAKGLFHLRAGRVPRAKELFRRVIELRPTTSLGYSALASAHLHAGEMVEAEPLLQAALRIQPTAGDHNNLGIVYYATARFEDAAREFRAAIEQQENAARWGNLGDAYRQLGRLAEARAAYARSIELGESRLRVNPQDGRARAAHALRLAGAGRCLEARRELSRAVAEAKALPIAHFYAAVAYAVCGNREAAVRSALRALDGGVVAELRTNPDLKPILADPRLRGRLGG